MTARRRRQIPRVEPVTAVENPGADDDALDPAEPVADTEPLEDGEPAADTETLDDAEPAADTETLDDAEPDDDVEPVADVEPDDDVEPLDAELDDEEPGRRAISLRLARLHLRMGLLALARAELEANAGRGSLDELALLDLAEARWRTGDTAGAGEAANAAIGRGAEDPLAYVIAAEAIAGVGRPAEARRLAARALEGGGLSLDEVFAGLPRSLIWPGEAPIADDAPPPAGHRTRAVDDDESPASAAAAEAFAGGRAALAAGNVALASLRLGVAIRLEPKFAQGVLTAIGGRAAEPYLALVAGDALRLLGREHEALAAFDRARGKEPTPEPVDVTTLWPDDDEV
jgi:tetratricopeptide (TPR) repeat protein